jgi:hypothetical protein
VVQSINLALADAYDGNSTPTTLSVSMTSVTSCSGGGSIIGNDGNGAVQEFIVFPNPTSGDLFVQTDAIAGIMKVRIYNTIGIMVGSFEYKDVKAARIPLTTLGISGNQLLFVSVQADGIDIGMKRVMLQD